jgi:predicted small secreted protein
VGDVMRHIGYIVFLSVFLSGCCTVQGLQQDIESVFSCDGECSDDADLSHGTVVKPQSAVAALPKPTGNIPIQKRTVIPVKKPVTLTDKPDMANNRPLSVFGDDAPVMTTNSTMCLYDNVVKSDSISGLYAVYVKKDKSCTQDIYAESATHIYKIIINSLRKQDIRLMNADAGFSGFLLNIAGGTDDSLKKNGVSYIDMRGCGLLTATLCDGLKKI